jgi:bifunctional non-homologous end joining protein LigD
MALPDDWPPTGLRPMLATRGPLPDPAEGWSYELKWDGIRALASLDGGTRLLSRNGNDITGRYPELAPLAEALGGRRLVLDGEIVALDEHGVARFGRLQRRMHVRSAESQSRLARAVPATYIVFDVLWADTGATMALPYRRRRAVLEGLGVDGPSWRVPAVSSDPRPIVEFALAHGFEGVVAKRLASSYEPGRRSRSWIKHPFRSRQEFVVGGWLEGEGSRRGMVGALLLGHHERRRAGPLVYAGRVGTGFTDTELALLRSRLAASAVRTSPFAGPVPRGARFVVPDLVVEVEFTEWTDAGMVRHPVYLGRRDDRDPATVVREDR